MVKKRNRDSDLLNPLEEGQEDLPESLDFHPILDPEVSREYSSFAECSLIG